MRNGKAGGTMAAGLLGIALAGCNPAGFGQEPYDFDWGGETYQAEEFQGDPIVWKAPLYRVPGEPEPEAKGTLDLVDTPIYTRWPNSTSRSDRWKVRVHVRNLVPLARYTLQEEGGPGVGMDIMTDLHGDGTTVEVWGSGDRPPASRVVVRDAGGLAVLAGEMPGQGGGETRFGDVDAPGVSMTLRSSWSAGTGRETLALRFSGFGKGAQGEVFLELEPGYPVSAGTFTVDGHGKGALTWDSREGSPLPGGVPSIRKLSGYPFEVRMDGVTSLTGLMP